MTKRNSSVAAAPKRTIVSIVEESAVSEVQDDYVAPPEVFHREISQARETFSLGNGNYRTPAHEGHG